jgi:Arc/MetJ-type ribon-helix-helix transcriptional regulator
MTTITVKLPEDLHAELLDVSALVFEHNESEAVRECLRRQLGKVKKSFIGRNRTTKRNK